MVHNTQNLVKLALVCCSVNILHFVSCTLRALSFLCIHCLTAHSVECKCFSRCWTLGMCLIVCSQGCNYKRKRSCLQGCNHMREKFACKATTVSGSEVVLLVRLQPYVEEVLLARLQPYAEEVLLARLQPYAEEVLLARLQPYAEEVLLARLQPYTQEVLLARLQPPLLLERQLFTCWTQSVLLW